MPLDALLQQMYRERLALYRRHEHHARQVADYDLNNAYQYILNREDTHVTWLRDAVESRGAAVQDEGVGDTPATTPVAAADAEGLRSFVARWAPDVSSLEHARHRKMLDVMLGEIREHIRLLELGAAGEANLLGRRPAGAGTGGGVLATRWME